MAPVLKTGVSQGTGGSNPSLSAKTSTVRNPEEGFERRGGAERHKQQTNKYKNLFSGVIPKWLKGPPC